jgi:hypothetical protein
VTALRENYSMRGERRLRRSCKKTSLLAARVVQCQSISMDLSSLFRVAVDRFVEQSERDQELRTRIERRLGRIFCESGPTSGLGPLRCRHVTDIKQCFVGVVFRARPVND